MVAAGQLSATRLAELEVRQSRESAACEQRTERRGHRSNVVRYPDVMDA
jgi:hypothetical protein